MEYIYSDLIDFTMVKEQVIETVIELTNFALMNDMKPLFKYLLGFLLKRITIKTIALLSAFFKDLQDKLETEQLSLA